MNFREAAEDWEKLDPDSAMHSFGDSSKYTAFIWVLDKGKNKSILYAQPGSMYHGEGNSELKKAGVLKDRNTVALFGRFGEVKRRDDGTYPEGGFVTVWSHKEGDFPDDEYDRERNRGFNRANEQDLKTFLQSMLGQFPMKVIGKSPARLPITIDYVFTSPLAGAKSVGEMLGVNQAADPICGNMKINIQGRPTAIPDIMGQLHMVRGPQLDLLKGAFCSQYQSLKSHPEYQKCTRQLSQLDDIYSGLKCGQNDYQSSLQAGKAAYRQRLKDIFSDPHKMSQEFRTQKEIDAAWDYLNKKEHISFREWYLKWNGSGSV